MAKQLQWRRGSHAAVIAFKGAEGEVTPDMDRKQLVLHDNIKTGGYPVMREDQAFVAFNEAKAANIAVGTTVNLTTATGNFGHLTGTGTISAVTLADGAERVMIIDSAGVIISHSAWLLCPGAASITSQAGDRVTFRGDTSGTVVTGYLRADGSAVTSPIVPALGIAGTAVVLLASAPPNADSYLAIEACMLSATQGLCITKINGQQGRVYLLDATGAPLSFAALDGTDVVQCRPGLVPLTSTTALALWYSNTQNAMRAAVISVSGSTVTVNTPVTVNGTSGNFSGFDVSLTAVSATKALAFYSCNSGNALQTITVSGTVPSAPAVSTPFGLSSFRNVQLVGLDTTHALFIGVANSGTIGNVHVIPVSESGGVFAYNSGIPTVLASYYGFDSAGGIHSPYIAAIGVSATRAILVFTGDTAWACLVDINTTTSIAKLVGKPVLLPPLGQTSLNGMLSSTTATDINGAPPQIAKVSANSYIVSGRLKGAACNFICPLTVNGDNLKVGDGVNLGQSTNRTALAVIGTSVVGCYYDDRNSMYPTTRPVALGTVI